MNNREYNIINSITPSAALPPNIQTLLESFVQQCTPIENTLYVFVDAKLLLTIVNATLWPEI